MTMCEEEELGHPVRELVELSRRRGPGRTSVVTDVEIAPESGLVDELIGERVEQAEVSLVEGRRAPDEASYVAMIHKFPAASLIDGPHEGLGFKAGATFAAAGHHPRPAR